MSLTPAHRTMLLDSAITQEVIDASGIFSDPTGMRFPWTDGSNPTVWQHRPDNPPLDADGRPVKYRFPKGVTPPLNRLREDGDDILLVEGTKQSYAALSHAPAHLAVYGMSGCWGWKKADLSFFYGRRAYVLLDADFQTNPDVYAAARSLKEALDLAGADAVLFVRTNGTGKDGVDDVLARTPEADRAPLVKTWLYKASPKLGKKPRDEKAEARKAAAARAFTATGRAAFDAAALADMPADFILSDSLMAERVAAEAMTARMCFSPQLGWMSWDGKVWVRADESEAIELTRDFLRGWVAAQVEKPTVHTSPRELMSLLSRTRVGNILTLTKGISTVLVQADRFDRDPDLLTCANGVVDLRDGTVSPFDPGRFLTTYVPTAYLPGATHEDVDTALTSMTPGVREYVRVCLGQGITGHIPDDDRIRLLHGQGSNGKSVLMTGASAALGGTRSNGAIRQLSDAVLLGDRDAKEEKMALRGARLVFLEELPEGARLNVNQLKKTVGTPTLTSRHLYKSEITWEATHTLVLTTNYLPQVAETDHGTWRRLARVPFPFKFTAGEPSAPHERQGDPGLRSRMNGRRQREALLSWLVSGSMDWYGAGKVLPQPPSEVRDATDEWRGESDMVVRFWSDRLVADPDSHVMANELSAELNAFLTSLDKAKWGSNIVADRFGLHDLTVRRGVEKRQVRKNSGLSRAEGSTLPVPVRYSAWVGVRFATDAEVEAVFAEPVADPIEDSGVIVDEIPRLSPAPAATQEPVPVSVSAPVTVPVTPVVAATVNVVQAASEPLSLVASAASGFSGTEMNASEFWDGESDPFGDL